jgi:hypothetical protein
VVVIVMVMVMVIVIVMVMVMILSCAILNTQYSKQQNALLLFLNVLCYNICRLIQHVSMLLFYSLLLIL